ncbi:hypothetical protein V2J09_012805 [Rumex salicifolius]
MDGKYAKEVTGKKVAKNILDMAKYKDIFEIIDKRWECQLHHPLYATGYFLNPEFFYANPEEAQCEEVRQGLYDVIRNQAWNSNQHDKIMEEISVYK